MLDESADNVERAGGFESTLECERAEQDESIQRIERALPFLVAAGGFIFGFLIGTWVLQTWPILIVPNCSFSF